MKKIWYFLFLSVSSLAFSQELGDVEIVTKKAIAAYLTQYGYVVAYETSDLYRDELFLPREWFMGLEDYEIIAHQKSTYLNINVPMLKVTYIDGGPKFITLFVPKHYSQVGFPLYYGPAEDKNNPHQPAKPVKPKKLSIDELKIRFEEQLAKNTLDIK